MSNFIKLLLFISFIGIWISHFLPEKILILLGYLLILTFGVVHGANDLVLLEKNNNNSKKSNKKLNILIIYVLSICFFSFIFYLLPIVGLLIFIVFSCYHFGEQHLKLKSTNKNNISIFILRFAYGSLIILSLLYFHPQEVETIIAAITGIQIKNFVFLDTLIFSILLLVIAYFFNQKNFQNDFDILFEVFLLVVIGLIFKFTPLIWGFSLYFILWHSIPSIKSQCEFLYGEFNSNILIKYLKSGALIWLISIIGLCVFYYLFSETVIIETLLFSFIAAITFPHVFTIYNILNKKTE